MSTPPRLVHDANAVLFARRWRSSRTLYQQHASWHEAAGIDARRFQAMVQLFAGLRLHAAACVTFASKAA